MNDSTKDWWTAIAIIAGIYIAVGGLMAIAAHYLLPH